CAEDGDPSATPREPTRIEPRGDGGVADGKGDAGKEDKAEQAKEEKEAAAAAAAKASVPEVHP
ncbi:MAG TPA: hypothetical protein VLT33_20990, partial [Labilithrix sp.]|nr:hypothetical protein [Labilithrix sp.]